MNMSATQTTNKSDTNFKIDYTGFLLPSLKNESGEYKHQFLATQSFYIGFGLDLHGKFKDLSHLCIANQQAKEYAQETFQSIMSKPMRSIAQTP